jgi:hypothetical protein
MQAIEESVTSGHANLSDLFDEWSKPSRMRGFRAAKAYSDERGKTALLFRDAIRDGNPNPDLPALCEYEQRLFVEFNEHLESDRAELLEIERLLTELHPQFLGALHLPELATNRHADAFPESQIEYYAQRMRELKALVLAGAQPEGTPPDKAAKINPVTHGLTILFEAELTNKKITAKELAEGMGISRDVLNRKKMYKPVRQMAQKLFDLFSEKPKSYDGPRGTKAKDGTLEAECD